MAKATADLLPSLSSDDDDKLDDTDASDDDDDQAMDESFTFGGILGEDGGGRNGSYYWHQHKSFDQNVFESLISKPEAVPHMDTEALIQAKRRAMVKMQSQTHVSEDTISSSGDDSDVHKNNHAISSSTDDDRDNSSGSDEDEETVRNDSHQEMEEDIVKTRVDAGEKQEAPGGDNSSDDEAAKAASFFDDTVTHNATNNDNDIFMFSQFALHRPMLRGIAALGFTKPTPIQAAVVPLVLAGRDVCASAVTGSGKTAAFGVPILERLCHCRLQQHVQALLLVPTRELAAQCGSVLQALAQFTKLSVTVIVGGNKNLAAQAAVLRQRPDVMVATPGRLLDHVLNTSGFGLEQVQFLVLDEADRLLDLGFSDEILEIVKACPTQRQTLLFSATMSTKVDDLVRLSLKNPLRVKVGEEDKASKAIQVAPRLEQEFVRIRSGNEGTHREAMLLALLTRTFTKQVIVFFDTKAVAHRIMILAGLCGISCAELHGNLTQSQRLTALDDFKKCRVDVLLATDLAARGLDIDKVKTVLNFEMPSQIDTYIHRIGRTARAGRGGKSCTLIGEGRRHMMKELIKDVVSRKKSGVKKGTETGVIRSRAIPSAVVAHFAAKIQTLEPHFEEVLQAEAVARMDRVAEMEAIKAQNLIEHDDEIHGRPQREWFATSKEKQEIKDAAAAKKKKVIEELTGTGMHRMTRKKRRAREVKEALEEESDGNQNEDGPPTQKASHNIKLEVRKQKRRMEENERSINSRPIAEGQNGTRKLPKKKRKGASAAAGDSRLFSEERATYTNEEKKINVDSAVAKSSFRFRGFDADKRLGKKKGHNAFKSKSKHRRRK